ncbi:MAG: hypothetical protein V1887_03985 [Candidatus Aenigmatarchaeota archaeon]
MMQTFDRKKRPPVAEYSIARDLVQYGKGIARMFGIPESELDMTRIRGPAQYQAA